MVFGLDGFKCLLFFFSKIDFRIKVFVDELGIDKFKYKIEEVEMIFEFFDIKLFKFFKLLKVKELE